MGIHLTTTTWVWSNFEGKWGFCSFFVTRLKLLHYRVVVYLKLLCYKFFHLFPNLKLLTAFLWTVAKRYNKFQVFILLKTILMKSPYFLTPIVLGVAAIVATPFQSAQALNATEVGTIAEAVTVRIDGQNSGSGVIIKRQGKVYTVLTAAHVVATEDGYDVVTPDGQLHELDYSKVKKLPNVDLALVEFTSPKTYKVADIGDSTAVKAGASIYVSGFPLPTAAITESIWNFSEGKVTANSKRPLADGYALVYSNDTLPGMSGGAVLNSQGKLIAIHGRADAEQSVQKTETVYQKTGFNLGIPINTFLNLAADVSPNLGFIGKVNTTTGTTLTADDWILQAADNYKKGNYKDAIKDLSNTISLNPKHEKAHYSRGFLYSELKQYPQAITDFDQAIALNPKYVSAYGSRGNVYRKLKQYPQAIADYEKVIALNSKDTKAYINRGLVYIALKQYPQAITDFDQVIALNPKDGITYRLRGTAYAQLQKYPQAIADLDQYLAFNSKDAVTYYNRGFSYYNLKQYPQAIADFSKAIALNPKQIRAYFYRGRIYHNLKQYPKAIADYGKAIALNPKKSNFYAWRGTAYTSLKQYPQAIADYSQAITLNPKDALAYYDRGLAYEAMGNITQAKQNIQQAAKLFKQLNKQKLYQEAIRLLQSL